jgi:hypothetical protein
VPTRLSKTRLTRTQPPLSTTAPLPASSSPHPKLLEALACAQRGLPVFPCYNVLPDGACSCTDGPHCGTMGKHPRVAGGFYAATTDEHQIRAWWAKWPDANPALRTGKTSKRVVIDIDPRNGGSLTWDDLIAEYGRPPDTVEVQTGGGGRHLYFVQPDGVIISSGADILGVGVDIKADGGYVMLPTSDHWTGGLYEYEVSSHPDEVPVASLPAWVLVKLIQDKKISTDVIAPDESMPQVHIPAGPPGVQDKHILFRGAPSREPGQLTEIPLPLEPSADLWKSARLLGHIRQMALFLGVPATAFRREPSPMGTLTKAFPCILHGDVTHPSAYLRMGKEGTAVYVDRHDKGAPPQMSLPRVYRAMVHGELRPFPGRRHEQQQLIAMWQVRLLQDAGCEPVPVIPHRSMHADAPEGAKVAYRDFIRLLQVKGVATSAYTYRFAREWTGLSVPKAAEAVRWLRIHKYLKVAERITRGNGQMALYRL